MIQFTKAYDLEERTAKFGGEIIVFCKSIQETTISRPIINQLIRSATSIGANYMEANGASSRSDFRNKIFICKKECQETKHWLRMLGVFDSNLKDKILPLWQEAQSLTMIFQKITNSLNKRV
ncbi:MAG: four helix bundle protein [Patescibacteria group bacterium]|jgi:four helix bundle protein